MKHACQRGRRRGGAVLPRGTSTGVTWHTLCGASPATWHAQLLEQRDSGVVDLQVDQEDAVHPALGPPAPVAAGLRLAVGGDLGEVRLDAEGAGRPVDDEAERWETPGRPFSAKDTALLVTPARRAMSAIVGRFTPNTSWPGH